jgi:aminoglycoside phosphotransferase (APT) family kinase protein
MTTTAPAPGFAAALEQWMDARDLAAGAPLTLSPLQGGSQNELWEIQRGDRHLVLRRPPAGAAADRLQQFSREQRLLQALRDSEVPHARLAASCEDAAVVGSPFYLMEYVDGWSPTGQTTWPEPYGSDLSARPGLAFELVRGAALLSKADWRSPELEGFGRPDGFHDRQVDRWLAFLKTYQFRELPGLDEAATWLRAHRPASYSPGIMHGDYQFANVMYEHGTPARLAAVIDWEMATVGDPLLDLGWVLVAWGPEADDMVNARYLDLTGMPSRDDLLQHYATISGRPVDEIDYYVVLARFKLGIVLEKSVARSRAQGGGGYGEIFSPLVLELERKAAELTRTTSLR